MTGNPQPLLLRDPLSMDEAREAMIAAGRNLRNAEERHRHALERAADAEAAYRAGVAQAYTTLRADGKGAGEADTLAKGQCAPLSRERDIAQGLVRACLEELENRRGDRASLHRLVEWSAKVNPFSEQHERSAA